MNEPSGFLTLLRAGPELSLRNSVALDQPLPGNKIVWEVAPALR
jgi:hypothetical protein